MSTAGTQAAGKGPDKGRRGGRNGGAGLCRSYQGNGKCRFGDNCKFQHVRRGGGSSSTELTEERLANNEPIIGSPLMPPTPLPTSNEPSSSTPSTYLGVCKSYRVTGRCRTGPSCKLQHMRDEQLASVQQDEEHSTTIPPDSTTTDVLSATHSEAGPTISNVTQAVTNTAPAAPTSGGPKRFCHAWKRSGTCPRGEKCPYEHVRNETQQGGSSSNTTASNNRRNSRQAQAQATRVKEENRKKELERQAEEEAARAREDQERLRREIELEEQRLRDVERVFAESRAAKAREEEQRRQEQARREREEQERKKREREAIREAMREAGRRAKEEQQRREQERQLAEARAREEEARRAEEARLLEEERLRQEEQRRAEQARREEQERKRREKKERQEAARRAREEQRRLEEERQAEEERRRLEEQRERERIARANLEEKRRQDAAIVEQYLVLDAAGLITCSAGLEVQHVVAGFDLCKITIKNLPKNARRAEISDLFVQQGVETAEFHIFQVKDDPTTRGRKLEAVVIVNAEYGQAIAAGLDEIEFRNEKLKFEVSENASGNAMASGRAWPFMTISWKPPTETIVATYMSREEAQVNIQKINGKTLDGRYLRAVLDEGRPNKLQFGAIRTTGVKITGWPLLRMYDSEFEALVGAQSFNLKTLKAPRYDHEQTVATLRATVSAQAGVRMSTYNVSPAAANAGEEWKVKVHFDDWEDVKSAHGFFDKKRLPSGAYLRAWHPKPLQYSIRIPTPQYQAQKKIWDALAEKKPGSDAHIHANPGDRGDVMFIRVLGEDKKAAGSLKVRVESLVAGERLDATYWHPSFLSTRDTRALFDRVSQQTKVFIRSDFKTRSLKVYGESEGIEEAKKLILEEVDRRAQLETSRVVPVASAGYFVREGLAKLKELIGEDNVNFNLFTRKLTIKGGEEARHHMQRLIDESHSQTELGGVVPLADGAESCPLCFCDATTGEELGCGHRYCAGCLRHFLTSAADANDFKFPLACMMCNVPVAIPLLRAFLTPQVFENLVEAAFTAYLEKHPQELRYCTTPDCKQIYRLCPACFSNICPACDEESHEGMTCEERRIQSDPAEQERLNNELAERSGYKRCPRCRVMMEKTEGCNHMECRCGAHFCWRCLAAFDTSDETYAHMRTAHGGIYDENPAGVQQAGGALHLDANFVQEQLDVLERIERQRLAVEQWEVDLNHLWRDQEVEGRARAEARIRRAEELQRERMEVARIQRQEELERERRLEAVRIRRQEEMQAEYLRIQRENEAARIRRDAEYARLRAEAERERTRRENEEWNRNRANYARMRAQEAAARMDRQQQQQQQREERGGCLILWKGPADLVESERRKKEDQGQELTEEAANTEKLRQQEKARRRLELEEQFRKEGAECTVAEEKAAAAARAKRERLERERTARANLELNRRQEAAVVEQYLVSDAAGLITCSTGLEVQHVVAGFDLCRITIKNLPTNVTHAEIADLFAQQGADATEFFVYRVNNDSATCASGQGGKSEAIALANTECGQAVVTALDGVRFREERIKVKVNERVSWEAMEAGAEHPGPVEPSITVSWGDPETIVATYTSHRLARANAERINGQVFHGRRLYATLDQGPPQLNTTSIKIAGWPHAEIYHPSFVPFVAPDWVDVCLQAIPTRDRAMIYAMVSSRKGVRMETYDFLAAVDACEQNYVKVSFDNWENAKQAQKFLNRKKLNGGISLRAWYPKPRQHTIRIPRLQYRAQKKMWDVLAEAGQESDAQVEISPSDHGSFVFVNITGDDKKAADSLKIRVESLAGGEQLSATYWHPSFLSDKDSKTLFDHVRRKTCVFVHRDFGMHSLKVYGEPGKVKEAKHLIKEEVDQLARARLETRRLIPPASMHYFIREGLARLRELFGRRNISLNLITRQIIIKGGEEAHYHLQHLINKSHIKRELGDTLPLADALQGGEKSCALCFNDTGNGEELGCGHRYCADCLREFLESARELEADHLNFPLVCPAIVDKSMCNVPVAIPLLRAFLTPQAFENLVEAAFTSYLKKHPQELGYCTTLDCKQVYRRWPSTCDEEAHEDMMCEQWCRESRSSGKYHTIVEKRGYKISLQENYNKEQNGPFLLVGVAGNQSVHLECAGSIKHHQDVALGPTASFSIFKMGMDSAVYKPPHLRAGRSGHNLPPAQRASQACAQLEDGKGPELVEEVKSACRPPQLRDGQASPTRALTSEEKIHKREERRLEQAQREEQERQRKKKKEQQEAIQRAQEKQQHREEQLELEQAARANLEEKRQRDAAVVEQYLISDAAGLITCSAGLEVQHVVAGFDLCRITIKNLPKNATRAEIADLFAQQGINSTEFYVHQVNEDTATVTHGSRQGGKLEATVLANAEYGRAIAIGLDDIDFREERIKFEVSESVSWNAMEVDEAGRAGPFITISWTALEGTIVAAYIYHTQAQANAERIDGRVFQGHRLRAVLDREPLGGIQQLATDTANVKITGWPLAAVHDPKFEAFIRGDLCYPIHMRVKSFEHQETRDAVYAMVSTREGVRIESYRLLRTTGSAEEGKVKVHFDEWEQAKHAQNFFDNKKLNTGVSLRSWHPNPHEYSIRIPKLQYLAQKRMWDALAKQELERDAQVEISTSNRGGFVFIKVIGDNKRAAGLLKVRVENLVTGERLAPEYWYPSFFLNRDSVVLFERIRQQTGVFAQEDFKTRSLKVYGESDRVREAKDLIREEVDRLAQVETTRLIPRASIAYFMHEGIARLQELLGTENVNLNLVTRRISIKGGEEARHHLQRLLDESCAQTAFGAGVLPLAGIIENRETSCPVCLNDTTTGEELGCGHRYCADCLRSCLKSAVETKGCKFPIVCIAVNDDETMCNVPMPIPFLRAFLMPQAFENLVETAFASYLERNPKELKYCTTPDCKQVYRCCSSSDTGEKKASSPALHCPSCFSSICPVCGEETHEGMTCEERRIHHDPAEQDHLNDELAERNGYKRCPHCRLLTEKIEGCNHMQCKPGCGAHFCWRCLAVFDTSDETYRHMREVHGGIHDVMPPGVEVIDAFAEPRNMFLEQLVALQEIQRRREEIAQREEQEAQRRRDEALRRIERRRQDGVQAELERQLQDEVANQARREVEQRAEAEHERRHRNIIQREVEVPAREEEEDRGYCIVIILPRTTTMSLPETQVSGRDPPGSKKFARGGKNGAVGQCKFYQSPAGCRFGTRCKFQHVQGGRSPSIQSTEEYPTSPLIGVSSSIATQAPSLSKNETCSLVTNNSQGICKSYRVTGRCRIGPDCKFQHIRDQLAASSEQLEDDPPTIPPFQSESTSIEEFQRGQETSNRGSDNQLVPTSPIASSSTKSIPFAPPSEPLVSVRHGICRFYLQGGHCRFGTSCKFRHVRGEQVASIQEGPKSLNVVESPSISPVSLSINTDDASSNNAPKHVPSEGQISTAESDGKRPVMTTIPVDPVLSSVHSQKPPCYVWKRAGACPRGDRCRFQHATQDPVGRLEFERGQKEAERLSEELAAGVRGQQEQVRRRLELEEQRRRQDEERNAAEERAAMEARAREEEQHRADQARREEQERKRTEKKERQEAARRAREEQSRLERERRAAEERRRREERLERERVALANLEAKRRRDAAVVEQYLVSDAAGLVTCSAGLEVRHVVAGFDLCKIIIKNLPKNATRAEIADLFIQQGVHTTEFYIFQVKDDPMKHGAKLEAIVIANAEYGQAIAAGLDEIEFRNEKLKFEVSENVSHNAMAAGGAGRGAPFITISWRAPLETIIAMFATEEGARGCVQRINSQTLDGHRIRASLDQGPANVAAHAISTKVKVTGWPILRMYDREFAAFLGSQPLSLKALRTAPYNHEVIINTLRARVSTQRGVQMGTYEFLPTTGNAGAGSGVEWKIKVQFDDWEDARSALAVFDRKKLDGGPYMHAWHPKILQYLIRIPAQQYQSQRKIWDALAEKKPGVDAHVVANYGDRGDVVFVKVVGDDKKAAGSLKVRVESLIAGERLGATYWHSSFFSNRDTRPLFERVQREAKVFVRSDFKTRSLKVYGEPERVEEAKRLIKEEVDRLAQLETRRLIPPASMRYFVREGVARLRELVGAENVELNLITREMTIKGGEEARHHLQRLIEESHERRVLGDALPLADAVGNGEKSCPVCLNDTTTGEELGCGHRYCADCLRDFLKSAGETKDFNFPLVCLATVDNAMCNVPVAIPLLRAFLTPQAFENLVEAAFTSYLEKHPEELKYCTTPDCKQIYRRCPSNGAGKKKVRSDTLQCPSCFSSICPACDEEAHEGMTCEERRIQSDPAEQERLNDELATRSGYKRCPRCRIMMEKTMGCNHMTCRCGAHICWRCMAVFDVGQQVYDHMNAAHGGIYDQTPAGVQEARGIAQPNVNLVQEQVEAFAEIERLRAARARWQEYIRGNAEAEERARRERAARIEREEEAARIRRQQQLANQQTFEVERDRIRREIAARNAAAARAQQEERGGWCIVM
ncbi:unnamed protein product [Cyclocybe aegerita]|uniref:RBR-type E3 ubiquitin transferase n=1 Tax=Cyclocybe aegerita TaxID=1973307 RepID=A0A8S0X2L4_CYCAE|nr:unnamed protein product [Cyclocybe aegerita]